MLPCDDPDRLTWRLYWRLRVECGCCTFYRGAALGFMLGAALAAACFAVL